MAQAACPVRNDYDYTWARNAYGLDPCAVVSRLRTICNPSDAMRPFWSNQYGPPTKQAQNQCTCSTVVYALVAACSDCQISGIWHTNDWNSYSANCAEKYQGFFNPALIPAQATPPAWAYFDVSTQPTFDRAIAKSVAANPPAAPAPPPATPATTPTPPSQSSQQPQQPQQPGQSSTSALDNTGPSNPTDPIATSLSTDTSTQPLILTITSVGSSTSTASGDLSAISAASVASVASLRSLLGADFSTDPLAPGGPSASNSDANSPTVTGQTTPAGVLAEKKSNTGTVAGGVIGAVLFLALLISGFFWWRARRRRTRVAPSAAYIATYGSYRSATSMSQRPFAEQSNTNIFSNSLSDRYSDTPEMRESTYSANAGARPSYGRDSAVLPYGTSSA